MKMSLRATDQPLDSALEILKRFPHDGLAEHLCDRSWYPESGVDPQAEDDVRHLARRCEAVLAREVAEVAAVILAPDPAGLVVDVAQAVANDAQFRVDRVFDEAPASLLVALEHAALTDAALPLRHAVVIRQYGEAI